MTRIGLSIGLAFLLTACAGERSVPAAPDKGSPTATASTSPKTPVTLLDVSGSGIKSTNKFTAGGDWDLNWSYDCASFGYNGNFSVIIYGKDSHDYRGLAVNELGAKGADVSHQHDSGTFYLEIRSECAWHVTVTG